jgi:hypothetical protein
VLEVFYQEAANSRSGLTSAGRLRGDDRCSDDLYVFFSSSLLFFSIFVLLGAGLLIRGMSIT